MEERKQIPDTFKNKKAKPGDYFRFDKSRNWDSVFRVRGFKNGRVYYRRMDKWGNTYSCPVNDPDFKIIFATKKGITPWNEWGEIWEGNNPIKYILPIILIIGIISIFKLKPKTEIN